MDEGEERSEGNQMLCGQKIRGDKDMKGTTK